MKCAADPQAVSVVMAVYNGARFLNEQLTSVLQELGPSDELIVVDDASSDDSMSLLSALGDERVRVHRNLKNQGVFRSFETGLRLATSAFIFLSDQDDIWKPGKKRAFLNKFNEEPEILLVVSDAEVIDENGRITIRSFMDFRGGFRGDFLSTLIRNRYLGCCMAFRASLLEKVLPIPLTVPMHDMWFGAIATLYGKTSYIPMPYLQYRRHGGNASPDTRQGVIQMIRWRIQLLSAVIRRILSIRRHN